MGIASSLKNALVTGELLLNVPMKNHTTFKIGGYTDFMVLPKSSEEIINILSVCKAQDIPYFIMGNGSNLLVSDEGFRGVIIKLYKNFSGVSIYGGKLTAKAGTLLSAAAAAALDAGLAGMEFAAGIPGTIGGAVLMNAGAYDGEMKDIVIETEYIDKDFKLCRTREHHFSYRSSIFQKNEGIITKTTVKLLPGNKEDIRAKMNLLAEKRRDKQPLNMPSAGSAFKRPEGSFAAKLIDDAGLRGYCIGGAQVSEKHTGFIVNKGSATAGDVLALISHIGTTVYDKFGVLLENEIKFLK